MLVAVDTVTGCKWARVVEQKGLKDDGTMELIPRDLVTDRKSWGRHPTQQGGGLILKSDGGPSNRKVGEAIATLFGGSVPI